MVLTRFFLLLLTSSNVFAQTDLSDLFAVPTASEIAAVKADWASRDYTAYDWTVEETATFQNTFTTLIASHTFAGRKHYGFVRYPADYQSTESYPVLVFNHGGQGGVGVGSLGQFSQDCYRDFFVVVPSFRDEQLRGTPVFSNDYTSDGPASEMDGDTDDALRLLNGAIANIIGIDGDRIGVTGGSRGGGVTHLMSAKNSNIKRTCVLFGATDHLTHPGMQQRVENHIDNNGPLVPPEATAFNYGADPYLEGTLTLAEARLALLRRSAIHFVDQLVLPTEIHHGDADPVVRIEHSERLVAAFDGIGQNSPAVEYYAYSGAGHNLNGTEAVERQRTFLCELLTPTSLAIAATELQISCAPDQSLIQFHWAASADYTYTLEASDDARHWQVVTIIEKQSDSSILTHQESKRKNNASFYRLKVNQQQQTIGYSPTVRLPCAEKATPFFFPNPATDQLYPTTEVDELYIYDLRGQQVLNHQQLAPSQPLSLIDLPLGIYQLTYRRGTDWYTQRLVRQ